MEVNKQRLKDIIIDFKDVINKKNWDVLFSDGQLSCLDKVELAKLLIIHEPSIFKSISTASQTDVQNILEGLSHITGVDDNTSQVKADYVGRLFDGDPPSEQLIKNTLNIARYFGYDTYTTNSGYWGDWDGIIVHPDCDIEDFYLATDWDDEDPPTFDEWVATDNVEYQKGWF